jgi:predicted Zn-dependent peptidase
MNVVFVLALLLATAGAAFAADAQITQTTLPNGMRVIVRENASAGVAAATLLVRAGSRFETPEEAGITHFLHRVMIRGTARRSAIDLATAAEDIGGGIDASGDVEYAEIRGTALARHWETLLGLVADVALRPSLLPESIQTERRLILSQIQTRADTPLQLALDTLLADLYGRHPYALPSIGTRPAIESVTRDALLKHYQATYRPERMVLSVSGRVPARDVAAYAKKLFDGFAGVGQRAAGPFVEPAPSVTPKGGRQLIERPAQQAQILMGFAGPAVNDKDYAAVKVLAAVLGGGMSGRLFVELRDKLGLAYSLGVQNPTRAGPAWILGYMGTTPGSAEAAEAGMLREIQRIRTEAPTKDEVARATAYVAGTMAMDRRTNAREAWYRGFFELIGVGYEFPDRYAKAIPNVTAQDVHAAARRYLDHPTIVVLRPR